MRILRVGYSVAISENALLVMNDRALSVELAFRTKSGAHGPKAVRRALYGGSNAAIGGLDDKVFVTIDDPRHLGVYAQVREEYEAVRRNFIDDESFGRFLELAQHYEQGYPRVSLSADFEDDSLQRFFEGFEPEFGVEKDLESTPVRLVCSDHVTGDASWLCLRLTDEYITIGSSRLVRRPSKASSLRPARDLSTSESQLLSFFINKLLFAELFSLNELNTSVVYSTARQYLEFNRTNLALCMQDYGIDVSR